MMTSEGMTALWLRIKALLRRRQLDRDLDDELQFHLAMHEEKLAQAGTPPEEAHYAARREFGNATEVKEMNHELWTFPFLETFRQDIRYGLRQLRRNPEFTAVAAITLALGIAAACVILSFAEAAVVRALPYRDPSRLVSVTMTDARFRHAWDEVPVPVFLNWMGRAKSVGTFGASNTLMGLTLGGVPEPVQVFDYELSRTALPSLGVSAALGRGFLPSDYRSGASPVVLLSYSLWQQLFGGRANALGRVITLDGVGRTIVGVMPAGFTTPGTTNWEAVCWTPLIFNAAQQSDTETRPLAVWGRLRVPPSRAQAALSVLALDVMRKHASDTGGKWRITLTSLAGQAVTDWRSILSVLFGAAGFLLAISCADVANLLLGRANSRQKEIAIRTAVGANRARILRQLLTESVVLGGLGGAIGILLARWGIELEIAVFPRALRTANFERMGIDWRVLAATLGISFVAGIAFGLAPALYSSKAGLAGSLKEGAPSAAPRRGRFTAQGVLIIAEVALSLVLLIGAGLMLRSFLKLAAINPGMDLHEVLTMRVLLPKYRYANPGDQIAAYQQLLLSVQSVPGVEASGFISPLPLDGINGTFSDRGEPGMSNLDPGGMIGGGLHAVSPGYFKTMGIPLLDGRDFTPQDTEHSPHVMIVNKAFVDRYWLGRSPVGREWGDRVVGEVGNIRDNSLAENPRPEIYLPFTQKLFAAFAGTMVVKTRTPAGTAVAMQTAIHTRDPEAPISQIETMRQVLTGSISDKRFYVVLAGVFALLALVLAAAGTASTVGYAVRRRRHEIGVRMALGAQTSDVLKMIIYEGLALTMIGVAIGIGGSLALTRFLSSLLYDVKPTDPLTFIAVSLVLTGVALFACYIPARRATKVDPMAALRHE
jgi:predicted permease